VHGIGDPFAWRRYSWGSADGDGKIIRASSRIAEYRPAFEPPGDYRLEFPEFDGFEPVPTQTVTVERGKTARVVMQLVKTA
jgi:hypothetical protein